MDYDFYLTDFAVADRDELLHLINTAGIDYPFWYRNGMRPEQAADEHIGFAEKVRRGESKDLIKAIRTPPEGTLIGGVSLEEFHDGDAEIGYFLASAYQGRRIGVRAAFQLVSDAITNHGLKTLHTTVHPNKAASRAILVRLGFKEVGYIARSSYSERDGTPAPRIVVKAEEHDLREAAKAYRLSALRPGNKTARLLNSTSEFPQP